MGLVGRGMSGTQRIATNAKPRSAKRLPPSMRKTDLLKMSGKAYQTLVAYEDLVADMITTDHPTLFQMPPAEVRNLSVAEQAQRMLEFQKTEGLFTASQAGQFLGISEAAVRQLVARGRLTRLEFMGTPYLPASQIIAYSTQRLTTPAGRGRKAGLVKAA
jgi:Transcriptional regulator, AbiEi antitoxin